MTQKDVESTVWSVGMNHHEMFIVINQKKKSRQIKKKIHNINSSFVWDLSTQLCNRSELEIGGKKFWKFIRRD